MASIVPTHLYTSMQLNRSRRKSFGTWYAGKIRIHSAYSLFGPKQHHWKYDGCGNDDFRGTKNLYGFLLTYFTSVLPTYPSRLSSCNVFSTSHPDHEYSETSPSFDIRSDCGMDISCIDSILQGLHESARTISIALQSRSSAINHQKLTKAWVGVDVDAWLRHISYQAVVYALFETVMEMGSMHGDEHPVCKILSPKISWIMERIEGQLSKRDLKLVKWFRMEQLPVLRKYFTPLMEKWSAEYTKSSPTPQDEETILSTTKSSSVAVIVLASSCCVAVSKLGAGRISCPTFTMSLPDTIKELVDSSRDLVSIDKLHHLATKAGFENEFLSHFGLKVLHQDTRDEITFWMRLLQEKLLAALDRENVVANLQIFCSSQVHVRDLAILGLFAFLGRKTRLFLSKMGIKDLDEPVKDFICYLECGILFLYPDLSSICVYQLFMEVVTEEIGWLDFYAAVPCIRHQERKRSKQHAIQAEKEIILSAVFGVCSDIFSSFDHYSKITQQSLDANLVTFVLGSKNMLITCLEDYWAAYDRSCEWGNITQIQFPEPVAPLENHVTMNASLLLKELHQKPADLMTKGISECTPVNFLRMNKSSCSDKILDKLPQDVETNLTHQSLLTKSNIVLLSTISDTLMGTKLLFIDLSVAMGLIQKQIFQHSLTQRERKKITTTVADIACVIPVAILMVLPVTAIGHAAIFAAIKKYIPNLIPSPYSTERLDIIKQLKRAKKMKVHSCNNTNVASLDPYK